MSTTAAATIHTASAWRVRAPDLAAWAWGLVNRTDAWGGYLPPEFRGEGKKTVTKPAKDKRGKLMLTEKILEAHFIGRDGGDVAGLHAIGVENTSRWVGWDIDNHGGADPVKNEAYFVLLYDRLASMGFSPLLTDSDGNGGFHLLDVFSDAVHSPVAHYFGKWLIADYAQHGITDEPEVYPKQPDLTGLEFGNWMRLPWRHHTREHWSRVWDGMEWREGSAAVEMILRTRGDDPGLIPAEAAPPPPKPKVSTTVVTSFQSSNGDNRVKRHAAYVDKLPPSVEGAYGSDKMLQACCEGIRFGLSDAEMRPAIDGYSRRSDPPWSDKEIDRKISEAHKKADHEFGIRLLEDRPQNGNGRPNYSRVNSSNGEDKASDPSTETPKNSDSVSSFRPTQNPVEVAKQLTDVGNAARLVLRHGADLRYCHQRGSWVVWNSRRWEWDEVGRSVALAKETALAIYAESQQASRDAAAAQAKGDEQTAAKLSDRAVALAKFAVASQKRDRISAMLALAQPDLAVIPDQLDADPWLLNARNGVVDLRTGELLPHDRKYLLTKIAGASYRTDADAPLFGKALERIFKTYPSLIEFLQKVCGYGATGQTSEQALFFLYGRGANGKTTLMDAVMHALGDYAGKADPDLLMMRDGSPAHPCNVADLMGRRMVVCSETNEGKRFDESRLKDLVGETRLKARFMRQNFFQFTASHKVFLYSNHKPTVRGTDFGFWRRMRLIPFVETIADAEKDPDLGEKLKAEADAILAWVVIGAAKWRADGLGLPDEVKQATSEYKTEMDSVGSFISECCVIGSNELVAYSANLYAAYSRWCESNGEHPVSRKRLGTTFSERGFTSEDCTLLNTKKWRGIGLKFTPKTATSGQNPDDSSQSSGGA